jgi:hypothetical protein
VIVLRKIALIALKSWKRAQFWPLVLGIGKKKGEFYYFFSSGFPNSLQYGMLCKERIGNVIRFVSGHELSASRDVDFCV